MSPSKRNPLSVAYGMGVDSTAVLAGLYKLGIRPDVILFANTRSERRETYEYLPVINAWLEARGWSTVTVIEYMVGDFKNWPEYRGLEENCLTNGTLPSEAFGFGSCSPKWKIAPQDKFCEQWQPAIDAWARGGKVTRAVGYDASPVDSKRACKANTFKLNDGDDRFEAWYPLIEWGWDRDRCIEEIKLAGLPVPHKSSCFFCPNMRPAEVSTLSANELARIVIMEARAKPRLKTVEGLWRRTVKGCRGATPKPGSMTTYIREQQLLPAEIIDALIATVPTELIRRNEAHAAGRQVETWAEFMARVLLAANDLDAKRAA